MKPIIKPSSELRKNYNSIAEICRTAKQPVFLTRNGEGDTVLMDLDTYSRREEELAFAFKLMEAERQRLAGNPGYSLDELEANLNAAIDSGVKEGQKHGA